MDRLAALLQDLPLPEIARLLRRTALAALGVGVAVLIGSVALSHPLVGLGACIGLGLGLLNIRLVTRTVAKVSEHPGDHLKRALASNTLLRLGVTTVVVIGLALASVQLGIAAAAGVSAFYFILVVALLVTLLPRCAGVGLICWSMTGFLATPTIPVGQHITEKIGPFHLYVDDILSTAVAGAIVLALGFYLRSRLTSGVPGRLQLGYEAIVNWVNGQVDSTMGDAGRPIVPLAVTLFLYILIANWLELIPTGHDPQYLPAPTGDINFTAAMAVFVVILVHATWIRRQGLRHYLGHYVRPFKLLLPINVIEELVKPVTLALRLFGNIFSGGLMLVLIAALLPAKYIVPIPALNVVWKLFDGLFVGPVQAFIFTLLTILYFESAVAGSH